VQVLRFEWDNNKADSNLIKHGVIFPEASTVFGDPSAITFPDPDHSIGEKRWITIGMTLRDHILVISHAERGSRIRIVSARKATRHERGIYEKG
jgi:uncharacterized DUF497 family protein